MMEAVLALAGVIQRFRLTCDADYEVKPWPSITLQPRDGIWLTAQARKTAPNKSEEPHATGSASHRTR
jgi:cytochrome P450